jgi:putative transposase
VSLEVRQTAEREIRRYHAKTWLPLTALVKYAGIPHRTWREWAKRRGAETKHNNNIPKSYHLTPEEVQAIIAYCVNNALKGYRMQCWEMVDRNVAADFSPMYPVAASITS